MRAKLLYLSIPAFANIVREGNGFFRVAKGIAEDAKIVRFGYQPERDSIFVVCESDEYPECHECGDIPADYIELEFESKGHES